MKDIILDVDTGIDDALALMVADWDVPRAPLADASAAEFIARAARERPGRVTLIATADPATAGRCIVDRRPLTPLRPPPRLNVRSSTRVDVEACRELIIEAFWAEGRG